MNAGPPPKSAPLRVNLGCGRFPKPGFLNVDWMPGPGVDVIHDLSRLPLPFEDASVDAFEADHILEHLPDVFGTMREIHRCLRPGGTALIRVPHFSRGFTHPEHMRGFDFTFPYYFQPDFQGGYIGIHLELADMKLTWFAQHYLKKTVLPPLHFKVARAVGQALDTAANLNPMLCSRLWCYYVGGFEQIEFLFRKPA